MNVIVNVDENWAIGHHNKLLIHIPADMKNFRAQTTGKVVVMGRKTLESFPNKEPLKDRTNIILTNNASYQVKNGIIAHSLEELLNLLKSYRSEEVYVIGGEKIYRLLLPYCDTAYVTRMRKSFDADTYFPNLEESKEWKLIEMSEEQTYFDLEYEFCKYVRV
ncbi:MAG TPA: dihydrofolate reductase [Candidatus Merdenecus merdavium]|nr:dihydrofolate reductase [Candidatus Merdenecus merdavium]